MFAALGFLAALAMADPFLIGPAHAGPMDDALAAFEAHDFEAAVALSTPLANGGNGAAQYLLAYMHLTGRGVPHDYLRAETYFRLASEQRDTSGQTLLGALFEQGRGLPQNYSESMWLYGLSAKSGDVCQWPRGRSRSGHGFRLVRHRGLPGGSGRRHIKGCIGPTNVFR